VSDVAFERLDEILVARLSGEIDIASAERLQDAILAEARSAEESGVVVDLSNVTFLDSTGVRLLFTVHRGMSEQGRPMAIVVPDGTAIASVLSIVEMASVIWMAPTVEAAIDKLFPPGAGVAPGASDRPTSP
jgi:stage II sporulation protein AA (anti-sigma F factor antagonist)